MGSDRPRLSVVIPTHNVEPYLRDALASLQAQQMGDFEAIIVDDDSEDATPDIADEVAATDGRFRLLRPGRIGVGEARNHGIAAATGEFLTFLDGDDLIPRHAYAMMLDTLAETGSDLVGSNARRFDDNSTWQSWSHKEPFAHKLLATHVREVPALAGDRMVWNKVYRRDFWDEAGLSFPDMLYEDYPVSLAAHVRAAKVDVLPASLYYWRARAHGGSSITQRHWEIDNMADRVLSAEMLCALVDEEAPYARPVLVKHLAQTDVGVLARSLEDHPAETDAILDLAQRLLTCLGDDAFDGQGTSERAIAHFLRVRDAVRVVQLVNAARDTVTPVPVVRHKRRWFEQVATYGDGSAPMEIYELPASFPSFEVDVLDTEWNADRVDVVLGLNLGHLEPGRRTKVTARLEGPDGQQLTLGTTLGERQIGTTTSRTLLTTHVQLGDLLDRPAGFWALVVDVRHGSIRRTATADFVSTGRRPWGGWRRFRDRWFLVRANDRGFGIATRRPPRQFVSRVTDLGDELEVRGLLRDPEPTSVVMEIRHLDGRVDPLPVELVAREEGPGHTFHLRINLAELVAGPAPLPTEEFLTFFPRLIVDGKERQLPVEPDFLGATGRVGDRMVFASRTRNGVFMLGARPARVELDGLAWVRSTWLRMWGTDPDAGVVLRCWPSPTTSVEVPARLEVEDGLPIWLVDTVEIARATREAHLAEGLPGHLPMVWDVVDSAGKPVVLRHDLAGALPERRTIRGRQMTITFNASGALHLSVG